MDIKEILEKIKVTKDCYLLERQNGSKKIEVPEDLEYFFDNYGGIEIFPNKPFGIRIVGGHEFFNANKYLFPEGDVIWEELEGDLSNDWYIIAKSENMSQYISIDLNQKRFGFCYDSFLETHANPGYSPIIAETFTELLEKILNSGGESWYWGDLEFESYGDAYDNE